MRSRGPGQGPFGYMSSEYVGLDVGDAVGLAVGLAEGLGATTAGTAHLRHLAMTPEAGAPDETKAPMSSTASAAGRSRQ